jgi:hypothetical protein
MSDNKKLFLSAVSREFLAYRELLSHDLKRPALDVTVQEDFIVTGGSTLEKLDDYIRACDGIIHLIGKAAGAMPEEPAVARLLKKYPDFATRLSPLAERTRFKGGWCAEKGKAGAKATAKPGREGNPRG